MNRVEEKIEEAISKGLVYLDLSFMNLNEIPDVILSYDVFYDINISHNRFTSIPDNILRLRKLTNLDVSYNCVNSLYGINVDLINQSNIEFIDFQNNNFSTIPYDAYKLKPGIEINFNLNPIFKNIPDYLKEEDYSVLISYIEFTIASDQKTFFYEAKMIVVGQGEVGKTSLINKLLKSDYKLPKKGVETTEGIDIKKWRIPVTYKGRGSEFSHPNLDSYYYEFDDEGEKYDPNVFYNEQEKIDQTYGDVNIWDFGGQEIYYNIHQFFLTEYALYILVWDARKEETLQNFDYWINTIQLLSQNSPVLIVMNKSDIRSRNINERELKNKFPNIKGFFKVSVKENTGVNDLRSKSIRMIDQLPVVGIEVPKTWLSIKNALKKESRNYIDYSDYKSVFRNYYKGHIDSESNSKHLLLYLRQLGALLYYPNDQLLSDIIILNPKWATTAFFMIVDDKKIQEANGKFDYSTLKRIWRSDDYPRNSHIYILRLLEKFGICFNLIGTSDYFVPDLLSHSVKGYLGKFRNSESMKFHYEFDFLPAGVLPRFICSIHEYIQSSSFWRTGLIVDYKKSEALITESTIGKKIEIIVTGEDRVQLLAIIRNKFDTIFKVLEIERGEQYEEYVPCICPSCHTNTTPHFYSMKILERYKQKSKENIICPISVEDVEINFLINGYRKQKSGLRFYMNYLLYAPSFKGIIKVLESKKMIEIQ